MSIYVRSYLLQRLLRACKSVTLHNNNTRHELYNFLVAQQAFVRLTQILLIYVR